MSSQQPDLSALLQQWWGGFYESIGLLQLVGSASNIALGGNQAWGPNEFFAFYAKFGGAALSPAPTASLTAGKSIALVSSTTQLAVGMYASDAARSLPPATAILAIGTYVLTLSASATATEVNDMLITPGTTTVLASLLQTTQGSNQVVVNSVVGLTNGQSVGALSGALPAGTTISSISSVTALNLVLSNAATLSQAGDALTVYPTPIVPLPVLIAYINLAQACIQYNRYLEQWKFAMALFVAHYCTLWLRSEGNPGTTASQIAASGLEKGIIVGKSAGDVSASIQLPSGLESWGAWQKTEYGTQLATLAKVVIGFPFSYVY